MGAGRLPPGGWSLASGRRATGSAGGQRCVRSRGSESARRPHGGARVSSSEASSPRRGSRGARSARSLQGLPAGPSPARVCRPPLCTTASRAGAPPPSGDIQGSGGVPMHQPPCRYPLDAGSTPPQLGQPEVYRLAQYALGGKLALVETAVLDRGEGRPAETQFCSPSPRCQGSRGGEGLDLHDDKWSRQGRLS